MRSKIKLAKKNASSKKALKKSAPSSFVAVKAANVGESQEKRKSGANADSISVRMYCHGFGDCFLLTFFDKGEPVYRMLIDCGMLTGNTDPLKQVIKNIKEECLGRIDVVIQSHEHKDHISGFNLKDKKGRLLWDDIEVDNVWLAWTENTGQNGNELAKQLKEKHAKKKKALTRALGIYNKLVDNQKHQHSLQSALRGDVYYAAQKRYAVALEQLLNFFDIGPKEIADSVNHASADLGLSMKDAMTYFTNRRNNRNSPDINFWNPGDIAEEKQTGLGGVKFYFLGPPKDYNKLRLMEDKEHVEMYVTDMGLSDNFYMALSDNGQASNEGISPFHSKYLWKKNDIAAKDLKDNKDHVWNLYHEPDHDWRKIETDWLHNAGALALHLDSYTNNTSLAFAIEFENSGKVLLFPADAQIGNWISWTEPSNSNKELPKLRWKVTKKGKSETITAAQLLERTVFYKVGHHASHNATAKKHGLELMSKDLVAMIPVDEEVAKKQGKRGWKMPANDLYVRLKEKTRGRIIRLDKGSILDGDLKDLPEAAKPTKQQVKEFKDHFSQSTVIITSSEGEKRPLYFEYLIEG